jgi:hypothetical protein
VHDASEHLNLKKRYRLAIRGSICLAILLLALADSLNSLQLIGTVTALLWFVIAIETWGNAEKCHVWIGDSGKRMYTCKSGLCCVPGEEPVQEDSAEYEGRETGDISFSV